jgi:hypothetical protein
VSRELVHGGGGSAGSVSDGKAPMATPRSNSALRLLIGHIRRVLWPSLMTYLRGRAHVRGWLGGGSLAPPLFLDRAPVHAAVGMVVTSGYPGGSFPPSWCERCVPCRGESKELYPLTSTHLTRSVQGFTVAEPGHGDRARGVRVVVTPEPLWFGSVFMCVFRVSGCGWKLGARVMASLRPFPVGERRRWHHAGDQEDDSGWVLGVPWVAR